MKLTDAQKRALLWLPKDGASRSWLGLSAPWKAALRDLLIVDLAEPHDPAHFFYRLTPAGIAARAELEKEGTNAE